MNTAPNRRASDNASSPPGTSPTRHFSDMLKESSGGGVQVVHIDITSAERITVVAHNGGQNIAYPAIRYGNDVLDGDIIFMVHNSSNSDFTTTMLVTTVIEEEHVGVDPGQVPANEYTFVGTKKLFALQSNNGSSAILIIPASIELIPGTRHDPVD